MLRFVRRLGGLYPVEDPFAALKIDEVLHVVNELKMKAFPFGDAVTEDDVSDEFAQVILPRYVVLLGDSRKKMQELPIFRSDTFFIHELALYAWVKTFRAGVANAPTEVLDGYKLLNATFDKVAKQLQAGPERSSNGSDDWISVKKDSPKLKLTYFPFPDHAEAIRLAFFIGNIEFEDVILSSEELATMKTAPPFSQVPVLGTPFLNHSPRNLPDD